MHEQSNVYMYVCMYVCMYKCVVKEKYNNQNSKNGGKYMSTRSSKLINLNTLWMNVIDDEKKGHAYHLLSHQNRL